MQISRFSVWVALLTALATSTHALAQADGGACGPLTNGYGPYDFRTDTDKLSIVTGAHFLPFVEALVRGNTSSTPGGDIDYTLRAIPNHHNALMSMMRLGEKEKTNKPSGSRYTVECWFDRALRFRPDDHIARMIYVTFLTKNNRKPEAMQHLEFVLKLAKDNAFTHQNIGLLYFDLGEHKLALAQAHKAIELGLNRPGLRDKLQAIGQWAEPPPAEAEAEAEAAAASDPAKP